MSEHEYPDNLEHVKPEPGHHNPWFHGGEFSQEVMRDLEKIPDALREPAKHMERAFPVLVEERRASRVSFRSYTLLPSSNIPIMVAPFSPGRKCIMLSSTGFYSMIGTSAQNVITGNGYGIYTDTTLTITAPSELWGVNLNGASTTSVVYVMEEYYD